MSAGLYYSKLKRADALIRSMAAEGKTRSEIAGAIGCTYRGLLQYVKTHAIAIVVAVRGPRANEQTARNERMASMYRQGLTLEKIGQHFDLTRERVRQILKRDGIARVEGGQALSSRLKAEAAATKRAMRIFEKWGVPIDEWRAHRADGLLAAYTNQRMSAKNRGITWGLNFSQWLAVWNASGKLDLRGTGKGHYCMSRIKDCGGYSIGNVHIQLCTDNSREAVEQWRGKKKEHRGVFRLFPGSTRPFVVRVGRKQIGRFATLEEAVAARLNVTLDKDAA